MQKLIDTYPYLYGRENPVAFPRHKVIVRMLDRHLHQTLHGKLGVKPNRKEDLMVTLHTAGQDVLWTVPVISILEDEQILAGMDKKEIDQLRFVYTYDNWLE